MTFEAMLDQALATLQRRSGVTYRVLLRLLDHFACDASKGSSCASAAREIRYWRSPGSCSASALCWPSHQSKKSGRSRSVRRFR